MNEVLHVLKMKRNEPDKVNELVEVDELDEVNELDEVENTQTFPE